MSRQNKRKILYLSYTGMLEPLGESQVLSYLNVLSEDYNITLISFEKPEDLTKSKEIQRIRDICNQKNILWIPKTYHQSPRVPATLMDLYLMISESKKQIKEKGIDLIHCRGYIATFAGRFLKKMTGKPFIFDMRAFWPDEMVTAGRIKKKSLMYRWLKRLESKCLLEADHVVVLTDAAKKHLTEEDQSKRISGKISTIPTCVNMDLFKISEEPNSKEADRFVLGSVGTVSGWFRIDWLFKFYKAFKKEVPNPVLRFLTREPESYILEQAKIYNIEPNDLEISSCEYREVPKEMQRMDAAVFFFEPGFAKLGSSPTRMGEFLACGVPCVGNSGVGDVANLIHKYKVGAVVDVPAENNMDEVIKELQNIMQDNELKKRCVNAAKDWFSLEAGAGKYLSIYNRVISNDA